jgi:hypothetical protein
MKLFGIPAAGGLPNYSRAILFGWNRKALHQFPQPRTTLSELP